ncbi:concanavalin A-like lectin/glucanase domain-containing protein [Massariosphaeria phaeospora]|uniref:Concanavalin A-like lectin/glucanase domain-containing protein n=1 Tax=Massariosphaeria phaeospora TaxID=100035 RepID=A0A7C8IN50_9PLEO|nr:concanavalin A-like lectin/glucanase domain-containing protein [Massariosphaeria phaeospora]
MKFSTLSSSACWASSVSAAFDLNRAGAVSKAPAGDSFTSATGTFTVPALSGTSRLSIWIGIGDSADQKYVLGGGILFNSTLSSFSAFFPGAATDTTAQVPVAGGNSITVTVAIEAGAGGGSVTIENTSQNKTTRQIIAAPAGVDPASLTAAMADWWVQAYQVRDGELVAPPSFGTVAFTAVNATTRSGGAVNLAKAGAYEIQGTSGQMYSKTTVSETGFEVRRLM